MKTNKKRVLRRPAKVTFSLTILTLLCVAVYGLHITRSEGDKIQSEIDSMRYQITTLKNQQADLSEQLAFIEHVAQFGEDAKAEATQFQALFSATFRLETGNGTSDLWLNSNNAGGIKCGSEYCTYSSKEAGLQALESLLVRYVDQYGYDLKAIRDEYCYQCGNDDLEGFTNIYYEELKEGEIHD